MTGHEPRPEATARDDRGRGASRRRLERRGLARGERAGRRRRQHTRERIIAAADQLGWRPSIGARAMRSSKAFAVGLILARDPSLLGADPFFPSFIAGVESELAPVGYSLVLQVVHDDKTAVTDAYRRLAQEGRVDGVFLTDLRRDDPRLALVEELHLRAIAVGKPGRAACRSRSRSTTGSGSAKRLTT